MASTDTQTEITLKGSVDIVSEFFFTAINSILYQRGKFFARFSMDACIARVRSLRVGWRGRPLGTIVLDFAEMSDRPTALSARSLGYLLQQTSIGWQESTNRKPSSGNPSTG